MKKIINNSSIILLVALIFWQSTNTALKIETRFLQWIATYRQPELTFWIIKLTNTVSGSMYITIVILLLLLIWKKFKRIYWQLTIPLILNVLIFIGLKILIHRPRPITMEVVQYDYSFPSGHTLSAFMFVYVCLLSYELLFNNQKKMILYVLGSFYLIAIIITRIYLGVHFPSDILASLLLGRLIVMMTYPWIKNQILPIE